MGIMTAEQYLESIAKQKPDVRMLGKKIENVVENEYFKPCIDEVLKFYNWANDPAYADDFVCHSDFIDEKVSFWTHFRKTSEDLVQMLSVMRKNNAKNFCSFCMGSAWTCFYMLTWDIDEKYGTEYHQRYTEFLKKVQREDLRCCVGVMDPKGDRSLSPSQQADPDLFLRVVEKRADGIVVNGAKMHTSSAPYTHYLFAAPSRMLSENEADYALSFVCPVDTPGLKFITRPGPCPPNPDPLANPASSKHTMVECLSVFDNVFIPWENVFLCGEWDMTHNFIQYFSSFGRPVKATCISARTDMIVGAASLIAEYNGVAGASHIRSKLTDMIVAAEACWGAVLGSAYSGYTHSSGVVVPNISTSNAGLYTLRVRFAEFLGTLMEIAGGVVTTMPTVADYYNPEIRPLIDKYFVGKNDVPTEDRLKLLYFIQELTSSRFGGYFLSSAICAVGTPETNRLEVLRNYDLLTQIQNVKSICNID